MLKSLLKRTTVTDVVLLVALFFCFVPYLVLMPMHGDIQPNAVIFGMLSVAMAFLSSHNILLGKQVFVLVLLFLFSIIRIPLDGSFHIKSLGSYLSVVVFMMLGQLALNRKRLTIFAFFMAFMLWFVFGSLQTFLNKEFGASFLPSYRTSDIRGVVGIAPEPALYGTYCIFSVIVSKLFYENGFVSKKSHFSIVFLAIFQLVFFSRSAYAILCLGLYFLVELIVSGKIKRLMAFACAAFFLLVFAVKLKINTRAVEVFSLMLENPSGMFTRDSSANNRIADIIISTWSLISPDSNFLGFGSAGWADFYFRHVEKFTWVWDYRFNQPRIQSGFGAAIFENGIIGLVLPLVVLTLFFREKSYIYRSIGLFLTVFMFTSVPIAYPLFGFVLGLACYKEQRPQASETSLGLSSSKIIS